MADNLQNVIVPQNVWTDLYSLTGLAVGTQLVIENSGDIDVYLAVQAAKPDPDHNSYNIVKRPPSVSVQNTPGDSGAWAFCQGGEGKLSISTSEREGFAPYAKMTLFDINGRDVELDVLGKYLISIASTHHQIHEGITYSHSGQDDLNSGASKQFIIVTPNNTRWVHFNLALARSSGEANFKLHEGVTVVSDGTSVTPLNENRNKADASVVTLTQDPVEAVGALLIHENHWGSGRNVGGEAGARKERILRQNTRYLVTIESEAATNDINWELNWYEHLNV